MGSYIWPDWDMSPYKFIYRKPDNSYGGFRIIGTRFHPVADFDGGEFMIPDEPFRLYRTQKGYRGFFTGRYAPDIDLMLDEMVARGADPVYAKYCRLKRYYAMRIDPKYPDRRPNFSVTQFVMEQGHSLPEWEEIINLHDRLTNAHEKFSVLC
jgi:hypothetical protein